MKKTIPRKVTSFRFDAEDKRRLDMLVRATQAQVDTQAIDMPPGDLRQVTRTSALRYLLLQWERNQRKEKS